MAIRQREWARRKRDILMELLGGVCAHCGQPSSVKNPLEFDCIVPGNTDHHRRMDWSARMSFYWRQYRADNLQLLCKRKCHPRKTREDLKNGYIRQD